METGTFFKITYGLYIVSSLNKEQKYNGHISNTVFQVTANPPRFAVASHKENLTTAYIRESGLFSISVLKQETGMEFIGPWGFQSGKDIHKFEKINYIKGKSGVPIVTENTVAYLECILEQTIDTGTHILFIGKVSDAKILDNESHPLTYSWYREVIKGLSPEKAPTFTNYAKQKDIIEENEMKGSENKKTKHRCLVCGYVYDPQEGDPAKSIPPGTAFEDLPEDWTCPVCGVGKKEFMAEG